MKIINFNNLILEENVFKRELIEKRMEDGGFKSLAKFELFIWDLEMFLQFQKKLGNKIILKGGAATQFYIPISFQRTSIDIDMICLATRDEVQKAIVEIENELNGVEDYFKFNLHIPKNPRVGLDALDTYYEKVPSICTNEELFSSKGRQEVKIEFLYSDNDYKINKISKPMLFALESEHEFNILAFENLFADKLTTLGPNTIGIPDEKEHEQIKQIYDVITLFISNVDKVINQRDLIKNNYEKVARAECKMHNIEYDEKLLLKDMKALIDRLKSIENDKALIQQTKDFQSLYLRKEVNRNKLEWAIVGYQLEFITDYIFGNNNKVLFFSETIEYLKTLKFENIRGPERGRIITEIKHTLQEYFESIPHLSKNLFKKNIDRIIWELEIFVDLNTIKEKLTKHPFPVDN